MLKNTYNITCLIVFSIIAVSVRAEFSSTGWPPIKYYYLQRSNIPLRTNHECLSFNRSCIILRRNKQSCIIFAEMGNSALPDISQVISSGEWNKKYVVPLMLSRVNVRFLVDQKACQLPFFKSWHSGITFSHYSTAAECAKLCRF